MGLRKSLAARNVVLLGRAAAISAADFVPLRNRRSMYHGALHHGWNWIEDGSVTCGLRIYHVMGLNERLRLTAGAPATRRRRTVACVDADDH